MSSSCVGFTVDEGFLGRPLFFAVVSLGVFMLFSCTVFLFESSMSRRGARSTNYFFKYETNFCIFSYNFDFFNNKRVLLLKFTLYLHAFMPKIGKIAAKNRGGHYDRIHLVEPKPGSKQNNMYRFSSVARWVCHKTFHGVVPFEIK